TQAANIPVIHATFLTQCQKIQKNYFLVIFSEFSLDVIEKKSMISAPSYEGKDTNQNRKEGTSQND
ncbi:MAG: hypothetical protein Q4A24_10660, partial [Akkermansia sp.]|nr:hypothetical protein [Akkermansia sp.]